jgi:hypothetical protein
MNGEYSTIHISTDLLSDTVVTYGSTYYVTKVERLIDVVFTALRITLRRYHSDSAGELTSKDTYVSRTLCSCNYVC